MNQKMNNDLGFTSDPWDVKTLSYPTANRLFYPLNDKCYVSKEQSTGHPVFFVTMDGTANIDLPKRYHGFSLKIQHNDDNSTHLICTLNDIESQDKFSILAKSVAKDTVGLEGFVLLEKAINTINEISSFYKLDNKKLTYEEYIGLWGELYFLYFELMPVLNASKNAIDYWIGPTGKKNNSAKQDFTFDELAFELKTTMSGGSKDIRISSKDQLDKITNELYLVHIFVNQIDSDDGHSLQEIIDLIREKLISDHIAELAFISKVEPLRSRANEKQLKEKLKFIGLNTYLVGDNFPSLTHKNVHEGIIETKYTISSASIKSFIMEKTIKEIIND
jgi:hypothetical protein